MFVTVNLASPYGISLGPRFFLIPNVGYATPSEATISELLAGKVIEVSDSATEIQIVSNGSCQNAITLVIGAVPTTTTTTTTTTTAAPTTTTTTTTTTTSALASVTITLCAGNADGSGIVDVYAYSSAIVDTSINIPVRWTGDLATQLLGSVTISSGTNCGVTTLSYATSGEMFSILEIIGDISPATSGTQEYFGGFAGSGSPCSTCS